MPEFTVSKSLDLLTSLNVGDIISTSKGLMTQKKAYHDKLGGELICRIY